MNYLGKFSTISGEVYKPHHRLTSVKAKWTWNRTYEEISKRVKSLVKEDRCMKYNDVRKTLYTETDKSEVGLGATLLRVRGNLNCTYNKLPDNTMLWPITIASKILSSMEWQYSNKEKHLEFCMHLRSSTTTTLHMKYMSSQTTNHW